MLPKPYYADDAVNIYNMDCIVGLLNLPDDLHDLLITSPPYNVGEKYEEGVAFGDYLKLLSDMYAASFHVIKPGGYAIINIDPYYYTAYSGENQRCEPVEYLHHIIAEHAGWVHETTRTWQKDFASLSDRYSIGTLLPKGECEIIMSFRKPGGKKHKPTEQSVHARQLWSTAGVKQANATRKKHQAAFPERLVEMILAVYADKGDTVIEPFLGSGTTAAVCKKLGYKCIGFDTDIAYCDIAAVRVSQEVLRFDDTPQKPEPVQGLLLDSTVPLPVSMPADF
jgi:adenine-specific DNA-methyltransferase